MTVHDVDGPPQHGVGGTHPRGSGIAGILRYRSAETQVAAVFLNHEIQKGHSETVSVSGEFGFIDLFVKQHIESGRERVFAWRNSDEGIAVNVP